MLGRCQSEIRQQIQQYQDERPKGYKEMQQQMQQYQNETTKKVDKLPSEQQEFGFLCRVPQ